MRLFLVVLVLACVAVAGCCWIDGPTTTLLDQQVTLANQVATNAAARSDCPASLQSYLKSDAASWQAFDNIAHGVKAGGQ